MSVNLVILIGNLTRDAEVRTVGQNQVAKFGLATSEKFRKQDGTIGENTEFHNVELWGQAGVHQYLVKGQQVYVQGSIKTDRWQAEDGSERTALKIKAFSVQLLGSRPQQSAPAAPSPYPQGFVPTPAPPQTRRAPAPPAPPVPPAPQSAAPSGIPPYAQQAGHEYANQFRQTATAPAGNYDDFPPDF